MNILNNALTKYHDDLVLAIDHTFSDRKSRINNAELIRAHEMLSEFCGRGKMIRGNLLIMAHDAFNGKNLGSAIQLGAAIEIIHSGALIHDDIMDNDEIRRGKPSLHTSYEARGKEIGLGEAHEYGRSIALVLGDYTFFIAKEIFARVEVDDVTYKKIQTTFAEVFQKVILGQFLDYDFEKKSQTQGHEDILNVYALKTASYSITLPLVLGAYLAHVSQKNIDLLYELGKNLGTAFQIQDDVIGLLSTEENTGKPIGSDIRENKKTLIRAFLEEAVNDEDKILINNIFCADTITHQDISHIKKMIQKYEVDKKISNLLHNLSQKAVKDVKGLDISDEYKNLFIKFIEYNQHRLS